MKKSGESWVPYKYCTLAQTTGGRNGRNWHRFCPITVHDRTGVLTRTGLGLSVALPGTVLGQIDSKDTAITNQ